MINPKILVTGATGKTGGAVVTELLAKGVPVRAMVRTPDKRSAALEACGAEVVVADIFDPGQLMDALRGVRRAYYCPPYHPFVIQSASALAVAARETSLEQIVGLSQWLAGPNHPSLLTRQLWLIDRMFTALPSIAHTIVNPGFFADSPYLELMPFAAHLGVFPLPVAGESRDAPPSVDDIARVAVAALLDPARHAGKSYRPTGPKLLSVTEMTAVIGHVVGHKVRHVRSPLRIFYKAAKAQGLEPILLSGLRHYSKTMTAVRSRWTRPMTRYANSPGTTPRTSKRLRGATQYCQHRVRALGRSSPPWRASWLYRCYRGSILRSTTGRKSSPCRRRRISRSTTPTGRPATVPMGQLWWAVR